MEAWATRLTDDDEEFVHIYTHVVHACWVAHYYLAATSFYIGRRKRLWRLLSKLTRCPLIILYLAFELQFIFYLTRLFLFTCTVLTIHQFFLLYPQTIGCIKVCAHTKSQTSATPNLFYSFSSHSPLSTSSLTLIRLSYSLHFLAFDQRFTIHRR